MNRTRFASALAMAALASLLLPSVIDATITFERTYGGAASDLGRSVRQTFDGGYVIAGWTYSFGAGSADVYLIKTDSIGDTTWTRTFGGSLFEDGYNVVQTADSGYLVAGSTKSFGDGNDDAYLIKTDAAGDSVWTRTYGGTNVDQANSVLQTSDGDYLAAGWTMSSGAGGSDVYLLRLDSSGDTVWTRTYGGPSNDYSHSIARTVDGGYVMVGWTNSLGAGSYDVYLIRTDTAGDTVWTRTYGGASEDYGIFVAPTSDSGCVIAGLTSSYGAGGYDIYLVRTDASGDTNWTRTYGSATDDWGYCVAQTSEGGYVVAADRSNMSDAWLLKTDASGDTSWTKTSGGPNQESGLAVAQTSDGGYVLTGLTSSFGAGGQDAYLIKTDSLGYVAVPVTEPKACPTHATVLSLSCEPNPSSGTTTIRLSPFATRSSPLTLRMYDSQGRMVLSREVSTSSFPLSTSDLPSGAYFIRCDAAGEHASARVVLQR
jgi:hypothetical protein